MRGRGGHGARPEATRDPVVAAAEFIMAIQTIVSRETSPLDPVVVTVGSFHGGTKNNIIPDALRLQLNVRPYNEEVRQLTPASLHGTAHCISLHRWIPG